MGQTLYPLHNEPLHNFVVRGESSVLPDKASWWQICYSWGWTWKSLIKTEKLIFVLLLTLKAPRKTASENIVCLCRLLNILANFSNLFLHTGKQCGPQIRLLLEEQSDLGPHCLQKWLLKSQADDKADDNCCDWRFKGYLFVLKFYGPVNPMGSCSSAVSLPNHTFTGQA